MAEILLIRHGQASFGAENYDVLSPLGWKQGATIGEFLIACENHLDHVFSGTLERQRDTAVAALDVIKDKTGAEYIPTYDSRFNELDTHSLGLFLPAVLEAMPELAQHAEKASTDSKSYQKIFRQVFKRWLTEPEASHMESWPEFKARTLDAFYDVKKETKPGQRSAIFTSGGGIATITAHVMKMPDAEVFEVFEPLINGSITRIMFNQELTSVSGYNEYGFLAALRDVSYITYR